jgi:hypothetical protein
MRWISLSSVILALAISLWLLPRAMAVDVPTPDLDTPALDAEHETWTGLLKDIVSGHGVDYAAVLTRRNELGRYRQQLATATTPTQRQAQLAFYINAYNALTVELVLRTLPEQQQDWTDYSVRQVAGFWKRYRFEVANEWLSLDDIEHGILRKIQEPRIHFAINCASVSCPPMAAQAYTATKLENQLDQAAKSFANSEYHVRLLEEVIRVNPILDWFEDDFEIVGGVRQFLMDSSDRPKLRAALAADRRIRHFDYDWSLNLAQTGK